MRDQNDPNHIISVVEFIKFEDLSNIKMNELKFVSTFLHLSIEFLSPVITASRSWGGKMWGLGWQKSSTSNEVFGHYMKQFPEEKLEWFK